MSNNNKFTKLAVHSSAKPSHYDGAAKDYDAYNEENSKPTNKYLEKIFEKQKIETVLDLTCGTGSQVFWLKKRGYDVVGADINKKMINVAKKKAKEENLDLTLLQGDMRNLRVGVFDAVISMFNAVGHLTKKDFGKAMMNVNRNLKQGGLYVFDIFNSEYLKQDDRITRLTIDWQKIVKNKKIRAIQYSTIDENGILASYTTCYEQNGSKKPKVSKSAQTLQIYSASQLREMLQKNGFKTLGHYGIEGSKFSETESERILTIARKL